MTLKELEERLKQLDFGLILILLLLAIYSYLAVAAAVHGGNKSIPLHVLRKQVIYEGIGFIAMLLTAFVDYRIYKKLWVPLYGLSMVLLIIVFKMHAVNGAYSWISLGALSFQPSELAKLSMTIMMAYFLDQAEKRGIHWWQKLLLAFASILPIILTLKEPALGQALVMAAIASAMFFIHAKRTWLILGILFGIFVVYICMIKFPHTAVAFIQFLIHHHVIKSYQANRIIDWLTPGYHSQSSGYTIHQTMMAVGSGKEFGQGLFHGIATNGNWVPNQWTDFIFSAIGEETGFIGASVLLFTFMLLLNRLVRYILAAKDPFGRYIVIGCFGMLAFQVFENVGMNIDLMPITGITLPFISYGGSSLVTNFIWMGICVNIFYRSKMPALYDLEDNDAIIIKDALKYLQS